MLGLSASIRVGLPSPGDPEGATGPGSWWLTGGCRPAYMWERADRPHGRRRLARFIGTGLRAGRLRAGRLRDGGRPPAAPAGDDKPDVSTAGD